MSSLENSDQIESELDDDYILEMIREGERNAETGGLGVDHERMHAFLQELAGGNVQASFPEAIIRF